MNVVTVDHRLAPRALLFLGNKIIFRRLLHRCKIVLFHSGIRPQSLLALVLKEGVSSPYNTSSIVTSLHSHTP